MKDIYISGFADEISSSFDEQLKTVRELGMQYISLRSADKKGIADFTVEEVKTDLLPRLQAAGVGVSSLGSPIGKVKIDDEEGFEKQCAQLETLCEIAKVLNCKYIRMFSFFMPEGKDPADYRDAVIEKLRKFIAIADLMQTLNSAHFKSAFDFANFVQCGEDTAKCWDALRPYIVYIHIKDAVSTDKENVLCGTGEGKIPELLHKAIVEEGYTGFLTLEPHLVLFDSLQSLETTDAKNIIRENKYKNGAEGYAAQYHALCDILAKF